MDVTELTIPVPWGHIAANPNEPPTLSTKTEGTKPDDKDSEKTNNDRGDEKTDVCDTESNNVLELDQPNVERDKNRVEKSTDQNLINKSDLIAADLLPRKLGLKPVQSTPRYTKSQEILVNARSTNTKKVKKSQVSKTSKNYSPLLSVGLKQTEKSTFAIKLKPKTNKKVSTSKKVIGRLNNSPTGSKSSMAKPSKKIPKSDSSASSGKATNNQEKRNIIKTIVEETTTFETPQDAEENSDFSRTYNMIKIQNPKLLASRAAKLNLVKQTLLNIENEKNSKGTSKDKSEKRCDDCGAPLSSGRDFILHRDKCEVRQQKLEKILSGLRLPKSLQATPQKDESLHSPTQVPDRIIANLSERFEPGERIPSPLSIKDNARVNDTDVNEEIQHTDDESTQLESNNSLQRTPSKVNKSPFRSLYNLYDGLNREHIDIILSASRNTRSLRSRSQEDKEIKTDKISEESKNSFEVESSQNEIIITTKITGNVIERNTLIRPVQNDSETMPSSDPTLEDEGQVNSRTLYETLKNSCQNPDPTPYVQEVTEPPQPHRELISDCPQGLPRSANIRSLFKSHVLNPIRRKGPILPDSKKFYKLDRRISIEKSKIKSLKKKDKLVKIKSLLNNFIESPNVKKSSISKKKKFLKECQKDLRTSWQIEETDKRNERAIRASGRSIRKLVDVTYEVSREARDSFTDRRNENDTQTHVIQLPEEAKVNEVQVVSTPKLFIPYNLTTPAKELLPKTLNETRKLTFSQSKDTNTNVTIPVDNQQRTDSLGVNKTSTITPVQQNLNKNPGETSSQPLPCLNSSESSTVTTVPVKRNPATPRSLQQILLKQEILEELKKLECRKWCDVCKKPFANSSSLNLHYTSAAHKKKVEKSLFGDLLDENKEVTENAGKLERSRKKRSKNKRELREITPETSEDEEVENMWCEDEEESFELSEEEKDEEEPVEKKVKRGRPRQTLSSSSENTSNPKPVRGRRSSTLALEQTLVDSTTENVRTKSKLKENSNARNKVSPQSQGMHCTTCNVSFPSEAQLNKHFSSKMHKTAALLISQGTPKVCSVCKVSFSVNSQLHKHYATQTHKIAAASMVNELEERGLIKTALFT